MSSLCNCCCYNGDNNNNTPVTTPTIDGDSLSSTTPDFERQYIESELIVAQRQGEQLVQIERNHEKVSAHPGESSKTIKMSNKMSEENDYGQAGESSRGEKTKGNCEYNPGDQQPADMKQTTESKATVYTHKLLLSNENEISAQDNDRLYSGFNLNENRLFRRFELNRAIWEVPGRYEDIRPVGAGSYGLVSSANDIKKSTPVAIKKLARPFQSSIHAKRTYRELTLLAHMRHENVIGLLDVFSPCQSFLDFNEVYLVTHLMGADLGGIIKTQQLSDDHIQFLTYQILRGLKYIHSAGIIHRDLKPSNIAVNEDCELKVLDFGLARHTEAEMTGYVATRWYRAPEIMLNWMRYNQTVDIWSVGCIMAELITGRTLFPGKDHIDQLLRIMTLCGTPDAEFMKKITSEEARNYVKTLPVMRRKNLYDIFAGANPQAIDLLDQMLQLDSDLRPTAEQALAHPYLARYSDPSDEPTASSLYDESFENLDRTVEDWKRLIWKEIVDFKKANPDP